MRRKNQNAEFIKQCICLSFVHLLYLKKYDEITISEICTKAGYGRTTYYRYFSNRKSELLLYISDVKWKEYQKQHEAEMKEDPDMALLTHIYNNRNFFLMMEEQNLVSLMFQIFVSALGVKEDEDQRLRYQKDFVAGGYFAVINDWTMQGCQETPKEIKEKVLQGFRLTGQLDLDKN